MFIYIITKEKKMAENVNGTLLIEASKATMKVFRAKKEHNIDDISTILKSSELEAILKVYSKWLTDTLDSSYSMSEQDDHKKILNAVSYLVEDILVSHILCTINQWKRSFVEIFIEQTLQWNLENFITNLNSLLPESIRQEDEESRDILNNLLSAEVAQELINPEISYFESLSTQDLQKIFDCVEKWQDFIPSEIKDSLNTAISWVLCGRIAPDLEKILWDFTNEVTIAIKDIDSWFDAWSHKQKFIEKVRKIENESVVRWSDSEKLLQKIKSTFESDFDRHISELIKLSIEKKLTEELENFESEYEIDNYVKLSNNTYAQIKKLLGEMIDSDTRDWLEKLLTDTIKSARMICKSRPPKVKIIKETFKVKGDDWEEHDEINEYALFKNEEFPVMKYKETIHRWIIVPKALPNGNVLITFKDLASGRIIEPDETKRLRSDNPYEVTRQEWKDIDKQIKEAKKLAKKISELESKIAQTTDKVEKTKLQEELETYIEKIPFYLQICNKLKVFDKCVWDYIKDKIPDFDPDSTKITPDIMENLREIAECSKTMLLWQRDALIIHWEAWVWKNVLIDIFAHFTKRPVFVFACWKKTDASDLTHLRVLDENGSKKLNSKVIEAITTPWAILVLDEINTLDAWVIKMLNALFDKRKALVSSEEGKSDTKALQDVLIFGTMNPVGYEWVQQLPQDVSSRFHFIHHDYDWMFADDWEVSYSDALRTYWNVNYFWKLLAWNWMRKEEVDLYEQAVLDQKMWNKLSKEKQEILERFKPISDSEFIRAWNKLFNEWDEQEVAARFPDPFVEGMRDIYDIVLYANYIRIRHKAVKEDRDSDDFPWDDESDELFDEKSFSPRLAIQALEQLHNGNETQNAKQAVIQTYTQQISDVKIRSRIIQFFNVNSKDELEKQLKSEEVKNFLRESKISLIN